MKSRIKIFLGNLLALMPYGRDFFLSMTSNRRNISYRKVFPSYEAASDFLVSDEANTYDAVNRNKSLREERERKNIDIWHFDRDYPLAFWLTTALSESDRVLELGGGIGNFYYMFDKFSSLPKDLQWTVAELPAAVELGKKFAAEKNNRQLSFINSETIGEVEGATVFICSGTLQYLPENLVQIISSLKSKPRHVFLHYTPVHNYKEFWTLQKLPYCELPYKIISEADLLDSMEQTQYSLVKSWVDERAIEIPFHRNITIDGYKGYYFKLKD